MRCSEHPDQTFPTLEGYQEHLRNAHVDRSDEISTTLTIHASESTLTSPDRCCPICSLSLATARALQSHIALHLERFSLFSLTRSIDKDENDADEAGSDEAHIAFDRSRDEDFNEDFDLTWEDDLGIESRDIGLEEDDDSSGTEEGDSSARLLEAASNGDTAAVKLLLSRKDVKPNSRDTRYGRTPLL